MAPVSNFVRYHFYQGIFFSFVCVLFCYGGCCCCFSRLSVPSGLANYLFAKVFHVAGKFYSEIAERSRKVGQAVIELGVNKEYKMIKIENKPRSKVFQN